MKKKIDCPPEVLNELKTLSDTNIERRSFSNIFVHKMD